MKLYIHSFICLRVDQTVGGGFKSRFKLLLTEYTIGISKTCASIKPQINDGDTRTFICVSEGFMQWKYAG